MKFTPANHPWLAFLMSWMALFHPLLLSAQDIITIDHKTQRFIAGTSTLDRGKYLNAHTIFANPDADFEAFKSTFGIDPGYIGSRQFWSPLGRVNNGQFPNVQQKYSGVRQVTSPLVATGRAGTLMYNDSLDYSTEDVSAFSQQLANYVAASYQSEWDLMPEYIEPFNEPMVHAPDFYPENFNKDKNDSIITKICEFHRDLGQAIHAVPELANLKMTGYASAFPEFEQNDFEFWHSRYKKFIDIAGADVDVFSVHLYDGSGINNTGGRRSGSNAEAILDLIETYSFLELGTVKPIAVTEYGRLVLSQPGWPGAGVSNYEPVENSQAVRSQIHMVMGFMERGDNMETTIPFSVGKSDPLTDLFSRAALWVEQSDGSYALTQRKFFYEVWKDVKGDRVLIHSNNVDIQTQAFVDGNQLFVVLNNLNDSTQTVDLDLLDQQGLQSVGIKRLKLFLDQVPELTETTASAAPASLSLAYGETVVLTYNFATPITFDNDIRSQKYYANTYLSPIAANTDLTFTFQNLDVGSNGFAILRLGVGRDHGLSLFPTIQINGQTININRDIIRGYDQLTRSKFFGTLEIPVDLSLLNTGTNTITVRFPDNGGHISSAILQVQKATNAISLPSEPKYGGGSGTSTDPYLIATPIHLLALSNTPDDWADKYFRLENDLDMSGYAYTPIGKGGQFFTGTFWGEDHTISNLTVTSIGANEGTGLFGSINGTITNLGLCNITIDVVGNNRTGAIAGYMAGGEIRNCFSEGGSINVGSGGWTGGLVGVMWSGNIATVEDCYTSTSVNATWGKGGVVGQTRGQHIINRVAYYGPSANLPAIVNVFSTGIPPTHAVYASASGVTDPNGTGLSATELIDPASYPTFDFDLTWGIDVAKGYAVFKKASIPYSGGSGTETDPYLISTPQDLVDLANTTADWVGKYFRLEKDLNMSGRSFTPIGNLSQFFTGYFNGANHVISNLTVTSIGQNEGTGLFGSFNGTVIDLGMQNILINSPATNRTGAIVGYVGGGEIRRCYSEGGSINVGGGGWTGGLIGVMWSGNVATVEDCYSNTPVTAAWGKGGVIGQTRGQHILNRLAYYGPTSSLPAIVNVFSTGIPPTHAVYALSSGATDPNGTGLSASELLVPASYPTFDFTNTWEIDATKGYAVLRTTADTASTDTLITVSPSYYYITNRATGKKFQPADTTDNAALLQVPADSMGPLAQWEIIEYGPVYIALRNRATGKVMRPTDDTDGSVLIQTPLVATDAYTQWTAACTDNGYVYLRNRATNDYFRPRTAIDISQTSSNDPDVQLIQRPDAYATDYTQWIFVPAEVSAPTFAPTQDPNSDQNLSWQLVGDLSDEFDDNSLDESKWQNADPSRWIGRAPGIFREDAVTEADHNLRITTSQLTVPEIVNGDTFTHAGGNIYSKYAGQVGEYYECRMKANKTFMSSTFWLINNRGEGSGCDVRTTELDIQESVGQVTGTAPFAQDFDQSMHSNTHSRATSCPETPTGSRGNDAPTNGKVWADYHVYGAWWKSPTEIVFYLDGKQVYTITPTADFNLPMYLRMVTETYDWNPVPADGGMTGSWEDRTTFYDWVRTWKLVQTDTAQAPALGDSVTIITQPDTIASQTTYDVRFTYQASESRDIIVALYKGAQFIKNTKVTVPAGEAVQTVSLDLTTPPEPGNDYHFRANIRTVGGSFQDVIQVDTSDFFVIEPYISLVLVQKIDEGCLGAADGQVVLAASGTPANFEYTVDGGQNWSSQPTFDLLAAGDYYLMARGTDAPVYVTDSLLAVILPGLAPDTTYLSETTCVPAEAGSDTTYLTNAAGCDSLIITETLLLEPICDADAGTLQPLNSFYKKQFTTGPNDTLSLIATHQVAPTLPACTKAMYVLTLSKNHDIQQLSDQPEFEVAKNQSAIYHIHTLIADGDPNSPSYLDLSSLQIGTDRIADLQALIDANADACADLDNQGTRFIIKPCRTDNGMLSANPTIYDHGQAIISANVSKQKNSTGFVTTYLLTDGNGLILANAHTPSFTVAPTGSYQIYALSYDPRPGSLDYFDFSQIIWHTTTISDVAASLTETKLCADLDETGLRFQLGGSRIGFDQHIGLYPNPVQDVLAIEVETPGTYTYQMLDMYGKEVLLGSLTFSGQAEQISLHTLPKGVYTLKLIQSITGQIYPMEVIKQ